MKWCQVALVVTLALSVVTSSPTLSSYHALNADVVHINAAKAVLATELQLPATTATYSVLAVSDGRWYPQGASVAAVWLTCTLANGTLVSTSSYSVIDWSDSKDPAQHCFNVVLPVQGLAGGSLVAVSLMATSLNGEAFAVGAATNMAVFVLPNGTAMLSTNMGPEDSPTFGFDVPKQATVLPANVSLSLSTASMSISVGQSIFAFSSGRAYQVDGVDHQGDAVWFITSNKDASTILDNQTMRADNDMYQLAEGGNAPMYTHSQFPAESTLSVELMASAESWGFCCNKVHYRIGAWTTLVAVGGFEVEGFVTLSNKVNVPNSYVCVGSTEGWPGCPIAGAPYTYISTTMVVPANHSGVVFFSFKALVQADQHDIGGTVAAQLAIDGQRVGSMAVQQLVKGDAVSTRTLTASYLATGTTRLTEGQHTVEVLVTVQGSFIHLAFSKALPLVWFG